MLILGIYPSHCTGFAGSRLIFVLNGWDSVCLNDSFWIIDDSSLGVMYTNLAGLCKVTCLFFIELVVF